METCSTPGKMLDTLLEVKKIVDEGMQRFAGNGEGLIGADDVVPALNYVIVAAAPSKMRSCIKYGIIDATSVVS